MYRCSRIARRILLVPALSALISLPAPAITLPPGFSDNLVTAVGAPTALAFTPDGRLLITTQAAQRAARRAPSSASHASRCRTRT
jgi:hypothetical protein